MNGQVLDKLDGWIFWLKMITYLKNVIPFGRKSVLIYKKLIARLSLIKKLLKTKIKPYCNEVTDFYDKRMPKVVCNHTCLAVIALDSVLKKDEKF